MIGKVFGKLTVIECLTEKPRQHDYVLCRCGCGTVKEVKAQNLTQGKSKSCGCVNRLDAGEAAINGCMAGYKNSARKRGYVFELTKEDFLEITTKSCHYCGQEPSNEFTTNSNTGIFVYSGIDRMDNTKGYTVDNCVPCCKICNVMKQQLSISEFYAHIKQIVSRKQRNY